MSKLTQAAKEVKKEFLSNIIKTVIGAGAASAGPPLGPLLGERGLPIAKFVTDFNNLTKDIKPGVPIPTRIHVDGKKYTIQLMEPSTSFLIKQAAGIKRERLPEDYMEAGMITHKHVYEIAKVKMQQEDIRIRPITLEQMCETVARKCWEMGVQVVRDIDPDEYDRFLTAREEMIAEFEKAEEEKMLEAKKKLAKKLMKVA